MVRRTRQMGVPVIADSREAIVGFDLPRLKAMVSRHKAAQGLGLRVANAKDGPGALVGSVKEGSPAARAGIAAGDVLVELSGIPVNTVDDLERVAARRAPGLPTSATVRREADRRTVIIPG